MRLGRIFGVLLLTTLFVGCSMAQEDAIKQEDSEKVSLRVDKETFKALIERYGSEAQVLDVRTPAEIEQGKIGEALEINFRDANFNEQLNALDRKKPVLVYCAAGGRSAKAATILSKMGFTKIYELEGGYNAWIQE